MSQDETPQATAGTRKKPRYFYGWNIIGAAMLAELSYAEHHSSVLGFFMKPFNTTFGWSRTQVSGVQSVARLVEAVAAPIAGPFIDRYGARVLMPIGAIIVMLTMLGISQVNSLWAFYLLRGGLIAIGFTLMGWLVLNVALNNWFVRKRGRAIGIARAGGTLSNILIVPLTVWVLAVYGWRMMFIIFAVLTVLVVLIPSAIIMRRRPEDIGQYPDGIEPVSAEVAEPRGEQQPEAPVQKVAPTLEPIWSRKEVLMTSTFWLLAACYAVDSLAYQGINISLAPYIEDLGYGDAMKASVVTFRAIVMGLVLPMVGFVAEHAHRGRVRAAPFLVQGLGAFLFLLAGNPIFLWVAVAVYGAGFSGVGVTQEVVWANYYGRLSLGLVRSLGFLIGFGFGAIGPIFMNAIFDIFGSYRPAFMLFAGFFVVAGLIIMVAQPPKPRRYATAEEMAPRPSRGPSG